MKRLLLTSFLMFATQPSLGAATIQCQSQITNEMKVLGLGSVWPASTNMRTEISPTNITGDDEKIKQDPDLQRADKIVSVAQPGRPYPRVYVFLARGVPFKIVEIRRAENSNGIYARHREGYNELSAALDNDCKMNVSTNIYNPRRRTDSLEHHMERVLYCNRIKAITRKTQAEELFLAGTDCVSIRQDQPAPRERGLEDIRSIPGTISEGLEVDPNG